jgi:hypothetical protein
MIETVDPATAYTAAKQAADEAQAVLVARLGAIKVEKKEANARLSAEAKTIRALLGRTRVANLGAIKARKPRGPNRPKPAITDASVLG